MPFEPQEAFKADMDGLFAQHAQMWTVYVETLKILVTVCALPVVAAGIIMRSTDSIDLSNLPQGIEAALLVTPILAFVVTSIVMHHRFVILFYARALNSCRRTYVKWLDDAGIKTEPGMMPTDPEYPNNYEPWGQMGLIINGIGVINLLYLALGFYSLFGTPVWLGWIFGFLYIVALNTWYRISSGRAASDSDK